MKRIVIALAAMVITFSTSIAETKFVENETVQFYMNRDVPRTGTYTGTIVDGMPSGSGTLYSKGFDGIPWEYIGNFVNGYAHGAGCLFADDGFIQKTVFDMGKCVIEMDYPRNRDPFKYDYSDTKEIDGVTCMKHTMYKYDSEPKMKVYFEGYADPSNGDVKEGTFYNEKGEAVISGTFGDSFHHSNLNIWNVK